MKIAIKLKAPMSALGNSRQGWLVYAVPADVGEPECLGWVDAEGTTGNQALLEVHPDARTICSLCVPLREYNLARESTGKKSPLQIIDYHEMLYPQYANKFSFGELDPAIWGYLQEQATKMLAEDDEIKQREGPNHGAVDRVREHWQSIVAGNTPFGWALAREPD